MPPRQPRRPAAEKPLYVQTPLTIGAYIGVVRTLLTLIVLKDSIRRNAMKKSINTKKAPVAFNEDSQAMTDLLAAMKPRGTFSALEILWNEFPEASMSDRLKACAAFSQQPR